MASEIELKLETTPEGCEALFASGLFDGAIGKEAALRAIYFDTPAHELHQHGHSLRIRNSGGAAVQTIKAGDAIAAGLFSRGEWELPVAGKRPVADLRTPVSDLLATRLDELVPVFEVLARRRTFRLSVDAAEVEIAIDTAEVLAGERATRFCEVELELVSGPEAVLFALARRIETAAPFRIGVLSKSERGYRLLGPLPLAIRAEPIPLTPDMDLASAFATIAGACMRQYRLNEAILLDRPLPEAVHQARIGLRRLRSAITLFKDILTGPDRDRLSTRLRDLAGTLGEARDLDVLSTDAEAGPLRERLIHARDAAHAAMRRKLKSRHTRLLMLDLTEWITNGAWRHDPATQALRETPLEEFAAMALDRLRRKARKHGRRLAKLDAESLHRLRKDSKKLRYAGEFLASIFERERKTKKFLKALEKLQDDLGALNDLATAQHRLASLGLVGTPDVTRFLGRWDAEELLRDAATARRSLLDAQPFWR